MTRGDLKIQTELALKYDWKKKQRLWLFPSKDKKKKYLGRVTSAFFFIISSVLCYVILLYLFCHCCSNKKYINILVF